MPVTGPRLGPHPKVASGGEAVLAQDGVGGIHVFQLLLSCRTPFVRIAGPVIGVQADGETPPPLAHLIGRLLSRQPEDRVLGRKGPWPPDVPP